MRKAGWTAIAALCVGLYASVISAQQKPEKPSNPAHLELTMEVAATTEEGYPSVLRVTVKNVGNVAVDMPMPVIGCLPQHGSIFIHLEWRSIHSENHDGTGWGFGCGEGEMPSLTSRIRDEGIHLRPGEYIASSENIRKRIEGLKPGIVEYWVEFIPPQATIWDITELQKVGYIVPTEKIETAHQSFIVH
ncbi:MAG: hypothetical protein WCF54_11800 [Terracidiphilus sp.]